MDKTVQPRKKVSWKDLSRLFPPSPDESEKARALFISYEKNGYIRRDFLSPAAVGKGVIIDFYHRLSLMRSAESPVRRKKKSDWIEDRDFARLNHRVLPFIDSFPFFAQLSILPSIRAGSLVLSPFTANRKGELNTVDSHSLISSDYCDPGLLEAGLTREDQFHLFIDAVHLLGKCVGYTLDYRMDRFAVAVLRRPELFRWIDRKSDLLYREMLTEANQRIITARVKSLTENFLKSLDGTPTDVDYDRLRTLITSEGLWTVPSCLDGSEQLPFFRDDPYGGLPGFSGGEDNLTSFKLHLAENPSESLRPGRIPNEEAVNYYSSLYIKWRDSFSFDFIKFGSIDNIEDESKRKADAPDLAMVDKVIQRTISRISHTGIVGSSGGNFDRLSGTGFNVLLLGDGNRAVDRQVVSDLFALQNRRRSLAVALSCGDRESDILRRIFLSRFLGIGEKGSLKYEISPVDSELYHTLENVYIRYGSVMKKGEIVKTYADDRIAWWIVRSGGNLLIPLISLENPPMSVPEKVIIDYGEFNQSRSFPSVLEYRFNTSSGDLYLCGDEKILCEDLKYRQFRLYSVQ